MLLGRRMLRMLCLRKRSEGDVEKLVNGELIVGGKVQHQLKLWFFCEQYTKVNSSRVYLLFLNVCTVRLKCCG